MVDAGETVTGQGLEGGLRPHDVVRVDGDGAQPVADGFQPGGGDRFGAEEGTEAEQVGGVRVVTCQAVGGDVHGGGQRGGVAGRTAVGHELGGLLGEQMAIAVQGHAAGDDADRLGEGEGQVAEVVREAMRPGQA